MGDSFTSYRSITFKLARSKELSLLLYYNSAEVTNYLNSPLNIK